MEEKKEVEQIICFHDYTLYDKGDWRVVKYRDATTKKFFIACGDSLPTSAEMRVILYGRWKKNDRGEQFAVEYFDQELPQGKRGIISYLLSLKIGIGRKRAEDIYNKFGTGIWDVLENEPERLLVVKGITPKTVDKLTKKLNETRIYRNIIKAFHGQCNMTLEKAKNIVSAFEDDALDVVNNHPYRLCHVKGFSFPIVDAFAISQGTLANSQYRLEAGMIHVLDRITLSGHVCIPLKDLCKSMMTLLASAGEVTEEDCKSAIRKAHKKKIVMVTSGFVYRRKLHEQETSIAENLIARTKRQNPVENIDKFLDQYKEDTGVVLADKQAEAVKCCFKNSICVLTGGPGTGKTTTTRAILYVHKLVYGNSSEPVLLAPTGRAARRMSEATEYPAATIHSVIGYHEEDGEGVSREDAEINGNLVIIDECSMMDQQITALLLEKIPMDCRVVFVGDPDQLPSVGCGNVLHDMIRSQAIPLVKLDVIYRQGAGSPVITNAHKILAGDTHLEIGDKFKFYAIEDDSAIFKAACKFYTKCVAAYGIDNVIMLNPYRKKTALSVNTFNQELQAELNPPKPDALTMTVHGIEFREKDKVMQTKNTEGAKNGDVGYIRRITRQPNKDDPTEWEYTAYIEFNDDGKELPYSEEDLDNVDLAYCTTIHKSQGSQYETVIMICSNLHAMSLKRNLIYTGITRAEKNVALIGQPSAVEKSILNATADVRYTLLADRLHSLANKKE